WRSAMGGTPPARATRPAGRPPRGRGWGRQARSATAGKCTAWWRGRMNASPHPGPQGRG
ncbi:MAG: hypothetical protein AVDCRST_MAG73-874, partial [uncultured Thermomicrobiales bacterium]